MAPGSNPRPLEHESSPITTRPGFPPIKTIVGIVLWQTLSNKVNSYFRFRDTLFLRP